MRSRRIKKQIWLNDEEEYNKWNGFVSKFSLLLLVTFLRGVGVGIAYMLVKLI